MDAGRYARPVNTVLDPVAVRRGRVHARYFRENFAQGGIDLAQIIPELVTNADGAITASGRPRGRIMLAFAEPDPVFLARWHEELRRLRSPAIRGWRYELRCGDDGIGVNAAAVDARLGALGVAPDHSGQRGLFGRGLRDVWLAQGGGRIEGIRDGRYVESWFFPALGDAPYAFAHVSDIAADDDLRRKLAVEVSGARVTVPLALSELPTNARLRRLVSQLVQLRPVLDDPDREVWLELPGEPAALVTAPFIEPDPERPLLFEDEVAVQPGVSAFVTVRRAAEPIPLSPSRAMRLGGLLVSSGRAVHETTLASYEGVPGVRHLYGEVRCEAIETLQRRALDAPRPQVVVRVDRNGLNEHHPMVQRLYAAIDRVLAPIVAKEERRGSAHVVRAGRAIRARDEVGLRALNDALRGAFDAPGSVGFHAGGNGIAEPRQAPEAVYPPDGDGERPAEQDSTDPLTPSVAPDGVEPDSAVPDGAMPSGAIPDTALALRFKQSPVRLRPGGQRHASLIIDPQCIPVGTPIEIVSDEGLRFKPWETPVVPEPNRGGWSTLPGTLRALVTAEPGQRLLVTARAWGHTAVLEVVVVRHHSSGWVREIARKDEDSPTEAHFDPEEGVVTVFEGRREFKALERAARGAGLPKARLREYLPYRMLEVEVAANAVYVWAAEQIVSRRASAEHHLDGPEYAAAVRHETQALRHRTHEKLMRAFLDPVVFTGGVRMVSDESGRSALQTTLAVEGETA